MQNSLRQEDQDFLLLDPSEDECLLLPKIISIHLSSLCALAAFIQAFVTSLKTIPDPAISRSVGIVSEGVSCGRSY